MVNFPFSEAQWMAPLHGIRKFTLLRLLGVVGTYGVRDRIFEAGLLKAA